MPGLDLQMVKKYEPPSNSVVGNYEKEIVGIAKEGRSSGQIWVSVRARDEENI